MTLSQSLLKWYEANKRSLPWRASKDPYRIWISEVMLQQTTVRVVIPYFEKFMKAFSTINDLARASEEKVFSFWSGLGYYSRARNIHKAAKLISESEEFPSTYEKLLELPGVGPYTAAAIASIAFNEEVAVVDGNVIRVITRLFDMSENIATSVAKEKISGFATSLIKGQPPSDHNQAMMELGATICVPQNPLCLLCPVAGFCQSRKNGTVALRPVKIKKRAQEPWLWTLYIAERNGKMALVKSGNGTPWLKNTWVLPGHAAAWRKKSQPPYDFKHSITHHKIFVKIKRGLPSGALEKNLKWVKPHEIKKLGVSSIVQKALKI